MPSPKLQTWTRLSTLTNQPDESEGQLLVRVRAAFMEKVVDGLGRADAERVNVTVSKKDEGGWEAEFDGPDELMEKWKRFLGK